MRKVLAHHVRLVDCSPADVLRSDGIGLSSERARYTSEPVSRRPVVFINMAAFGTRPGGIAGINDSSRNPVKLGLILYELPKLGEAPRVDRPSLRLSSRNPRSDSLEIFEGDATPCVLSLTNDLFAGPVVYVAGHAPFLLTTLPEKPPGALGLLRLKACSDASVAVSQTFELPARVSFAVRICRYILYPEVN